MTDATYPIVPLCPECQGMGYTEDPLGRREPCPYCQQTGICQRRPCPDCRGQGYLDGSVPLGYPRLICRRCGGTGNVWKGTVPNYGSPMDPEDLSDAVRQVVALAQDRVGPDSIGAQQYHVDGQPQKFETMPLLGLIDYSIEEALDHINYGVMLTLRLDRLRRQVEEALKRSDVVLKEQPHEED